MTCRLHAAGKKKNLILSGPLKKKQYVNAREKKVVQKNVSRVWIMTITVPGGIARTPWNFHGQYKRSSLQKKKRLFPFFRVEGDFFPRYNAEESIIAFGSVSPSTFRLVNPLEDRSKKGFFMKIGARKFSSDSTEKPFCTLFNPFAGWQGENGAKTYIDHSKKTLLGRRGNPTEIFKGKIPQRDVTESGAWVIKPPSSSSSPCIKFIRRKVSVEGKRNIKGLWADCCQNFVSPFNSSFSFANCRETSSSCCCLFLRLRNPLLIPTKREREREKTTSVADFLRFFLHPRSTWWEIVACSEYAMKNSSGFFKRLRRL